MATEEKEINEDVFEATQPEDIDGYYGEQNEQLPKNSLGFKGDEKLSVYPNQEFLAEKLFERIKLAFKIYKQPFEGHYKKIDFTVIILLHFKLVDFLK